MDRPAKCEVCEGQMFYIGDERHEEEFKVTIIIDRFDADELEKTVWVHKRCFLDLVLKFRELQEFQATKPFRNLLGEINNVARNLTERMTNSI